MKTLIRFIPLVLVFLAIHTNAQNAPDVNLYFDFSLQNCPSNPTIETSFELSSADGTTWDVGFIMLTLTVDEIVLGTPPQVVNAPSGWMSDVYKQGNQWQIELVDPTGNNTIAAGNTPINAFKLHWPYIQEGVVFSINIDDADLGVNNSLLDEQLHYPNGLNIAGSDDCANQVGEVDFYWNNPSLGNCPNNPTLQSTVSFASHNPGEVWTNNFVQLVLQYDNAILSAPRIINAPQGWTADVYQQGLEWLVELTSATGIDITNTIAPWFILEWDYLQEGMPFSIVLNDIDLGLNVPNEIVHRPNGNIISGQTMCPCDVNITNTFITCTDPCRSLGQIFFDIELNNTPGGNLIISTGSQQKTISVPPGDIVVLDESFSNVSLNQSHTILLASIDGTTCQDSLWVSNPVCGPCSLSITSITPGPCNSTSNSYEVAIDITGMTLCQNHVFVTYDNQQPKIYPLSGSGIVVLTDLPADGQSHAVTVSDVQIGSACTATAVFNAPIPCDLSPTINMALDPTKITIGPNPLRAGQSLSIASNLPIRQISIFDLSGRTVYEVSGLQSLEQSIQLPNINPGLYLIYTENTEGIRSEKLIIQ